MPIEIELVKLPLKTKILHVAESNDIPVIGNGDSEKQAVAMLLREMASYVEANPDIIPTLISVNPTTVDFRAKRFTK